MYSQIFVYTTLINNAIADSTGGWRGRHLALRNLRVLGTRVSFMSGHVLPQDGSATLRAPRITTFNGGNMPSKLRLGAVRFVALHILASASTSIWLQAHVPICAVTCAPSSRVGSRTNWTRISTLCMGARRGDTCVCYRRAKGRIIALRGFGRNRMRLGNWVSHR